MHKNCFSLRPFLRGVGDLGAVCKPIREFRNSAALKYAAAAAAPKTRPGKVPPKMVKLRKQFQADNDLPIFLKGGSMDNILYRLTWVLCFLGIGGDVWLWLGYIIA
ncbi:cytochrome c oxidase subunit 7A1, mitochondrial [Drosophila mauritiana]|uniref:Cytochrome c oxidase subunit 7A1, mitochondrial n=1 Tax=Drosophila mauritiana TaxID=7226 RepID=A0A6P8K8F5_DROMA|nr:cytochrome c oxidase subunit 7A1, mitochondrial [Drosophila mauritiana]